MNKSLVLETLELLSGMINADILPAVYERRAREVLKAWAAGSLKESPGPELTPENAVSLEEAAQMSDGELMQRIKLSAGRPANLLD